MSDEQKTCCCSFELRRACIAMGSVQLILGVIAVTVFSISSSLLQGSYELAAAAVLALVVGVMVLLNGILLLSGAMLRRTWPLCAWTIIQFLIFILAITSIIIVLDHDKVPTEYKLMVIPAIFGTILQVYFMCEVVRLRQMFLPPNSTHHPTEPTQLTFANLFLACDCCNCWHQIYFCSAILNDG